MAAQARAPYDRPPSHGDVRERPWANHTIPGAEDVTFLEAWNIACPRCGVGPGWGCRTHTGYSARTHKARAAEAREQKEG